MKKYKVVFKLPIFLFFAVFLIIEREFAAAGALSGLSLCAKVVIPSVFPFMVLSNLFNKLGLCYDFSKMLSKPLYKLFGTKFDGGGVVLLGLISGFPVCASLSSSLYKDGKISKNEAQTLICYTNNATPAFIVGFIGIGVFSSLKHGIILYLCVIFSSLLYGMLSSKNLKKENKSYVYPLTSPTASFFNVFTESVGISCLSMLNVCGFIVIFSVLSSFIMFVFENFGLPDVLCSVFLVVCELTVGITNISPLSSFPEPVFFASIGAFVSFSGLCVLAQVYSASSACGAKGYLKAKIIQSAVTFCLCLLGFYLFLR